MIDINDLLQMVKEAMEDLDDMGKNFDSLEAINWRLQESAGGLLNDVRVYKSLFQPEVRNVVNTYVTADKQRLQENVYGKVKRFSSLRDYVGVRQAPRDAVNEVLSTLGAASLIGLSSSLVAYSLPVLAEVGIDFDPSEGVELAQEEATFAKKKAQFYHGIAGAIVDVARYEGLSTQTVATDDRFVGRLLEGSFATRQAAQDYFTQETALESERLTYTRKLHGLLHDAVQHDEGFKEAYDSIRSEMAIPTEKAIQALYDATVAFRTAQVNRV